MALFYSDSEDLTPTVLKGRHTMGDRAAGISIVHLISWILLFTILSLATAVALNWFLRRRQQDADENPVSTIEEETLLAAGGSDAIPIRVSDAPKSPSDSVSGSSPSSSSGNLSRQRFLEARRAAAQRTYGATDAAEEVNQA